MKEEYHHYKRRDVHRVGRSKRGHCHRRQCILLCKWCNVSSVPLVEKKEKKRSPFDNKEKHRNGKLETGGNLVGLRGSRYILGKVDIQKDLILQAGSCLCVHYPTLQPHRIPIR